MDYRIMNPAERKYTFRQSQQISMQTGLIGYLRADFGSTGKEFYSTWNDFRKDLKTDDFKKEFDLVINSYRSGDGEFLIGRSAMTKFCYEHPESSYEDDRNHYGVRVDTEQYSYLMRLNPNRGEYNLYCYCYQREWLDNHLQKAEKGIRFIDPHYKEQFTIPDGDKIRITLSSGEHYDRECRYIDDYHLEVGDNLYHTQEEIYDSLAEIVEENEPSETVEATQGEAVMLPEYAKLYEQNSDIVGWIRIDDTKINYPVMQSPQELNFYLKHGFDKEYTDYGCPYMSESCDVNKPSDNLIVYGHHMKNGTMFSDLENFKSKEFWEEHKTFRFDTLYMKQTYEIIAVFKTAVYTGSENEFKYYQFVDAATKEQFDGYIQRAKEKAFYDTGVSAEYGDKLITLSTCEYSGQNSRLVVVAKKVTESGGSNAPSNDGATEIQS